jgi:4-amino-4-deoxy-L-arabinose transferase-like glycosyltransferase
VPHGIDRRRAREDAAVVVQEPLDGHLDREPDRRSFRIRLAIITALAGAWRVAYLVVAKWHTHLGVNDSLYYAYQADRNAIGDWFPHPFSTAPGAAHGPLTSAYLTLWTLHGGDATAWQRTGNTVLGIVTVALIGVLGGRLAGPRVGLVAAAIAAVYPNLWINDSIVMSESLASLLVVLALVVATVLDRRPRSRTAALLGAIVGLAALTRSELLLLLPGFALVAWWRRPNRVRGWRISAALVAATVATVTPWTLYNLHRFERPVLLSTNDGGTLLGAYCDTTFEAGSQRGGWSNACVDPSIAAHPEADESELAAVQRELAVDYARDHLGAVPVVVAARLGRLVDVFGLRSSIGLDVGEEKARWAVWAGIVSWWVLAPLAIVGWRRSRGAEVDGGVTRWWLVVPVVAVVATSALFYGSHRIRSPAEPVVIVLAATALASGRNDEGDGGRLTAARRAR